jgi:HAE1 family hydrophobic/amphiphilic exporter-1
VTILGVLPLVRATSAGAAGRPALGTVVFGGMITSTVRAIFVPAFYAVFQWLSELSVAPTTVVTHSSETTMTPSESAMAAEHGTLS